LRLATVLWLSDTVPYSDYAYYDMAGAKIASDWSFFFDASQVEYYGRFGWWPPLYPFFVGGLYSFSASTIGSSSSCKSSSARSSVGSSIGSDAGWV